MPSCQRRPDALEFATAIAALAPLEALGAAPFSAPPPGVAISHLFFWITHVVGLRDRLLAREFQRNGARVAEWRVLLAIAIRPGISIRDAAEYTLIDPTSLSRTVAHMQRAGLITRKQDPDDLRAVQLTMTAAGGKLFDELWRIADAVNNRACRGLPEGAASLMSLALHQVWVDLDQASREGSAAEQP